MSLIEWQTTFETGNAAIDFEHRELIELLNRLYADLGGTASSDQILDFLGEVFAKISAHFALEESIMRRERYDQYDVHKDDHERLLDEIRDIMDAFEDGAYVDLEAELGEGLRRWFVDHFATMDARLHRVIPDMRV